MDRARATYSGTTSFVSVLLATLLGFAVRANLLGRQSLWTDEAASLSYARSPDLLVLVERVLAADPHPPLYYAMLHFWIRVAGESDFAIRFPSLVFGVLSVVLIYKMACHAFSEKRLPLLILLLAAASPFLVYYSQEARMYSMAGFLALVSIYVLLRAVNRGGLWWAAYIAASIAALYTLSVAVALIPAACVFLGWSFWRRRSGSRRLVLGPAGSLLSLVASVCLWNALQIRQFGEFIVSPDASRLPLLAVDTLKEALLVGVFGVTLDPSYSAARAYLRLTRWEQVVDPPYTTAAAVLILALASWGIVSAFRKKRTEAFWLAVLFVVATWADAYFLRLTTTRYASRLTFIASPLFLTILCVGVTALPGRMLRAVAVIALLGGMGYSLWQNYENPVFSRSEYRSLATYLEAEMEEGDAIYLHGPPLTLLDSHYFQMPHPVYTIPGSAPGRDSWPEMEQQLQSLSDSYSRIWLVLGGETDYDPERLVEGWLLQHGYQVEGEWFGNVRLELFIFPKTAGQGACSPSQLGKTLSLVESSSVGDGTFTPGQGIGLSFTWRLLSRPESPLRLSLRLTDSDGQTWVQRDEDLGSYLNPVTNWPLNESVSTRGGLRIPPGIPPGDYALKALVYDSSGQPLPGGELGALVVHIVPGRPASPERLKPPVSTDLTLGPLRAIGYYLPAEVMPGEKVLLRLYWVAEAIPQADYSLVLRVGDGPEQALPLIPTYPSSLWRQGEAIVSESFLVVPATASGPQPVTLGLAGGSGAQAVHLADINVKKLERNFKEPAVQHAYRTNLGGKMELLGLDVGESVLPDGTLSVAPGSTVDLSLQWKCLGELQTSYTVFVQLLNEEGRLVAQEDAIPASGLRPTTSWVTGEVISDAHRLEIPGSLPPGRYTLIAGAYDATSGRRLATAEGDYVQLMKVVLAGS